MATRTKGFSIVEVLVLVLILALIGFISWKVWDTMNQPANTEEPTSQQQSTGDELNSTKDLDDVDKTLDNTDVEGDEAKQLDSQVSF